jgi:hypothetical protein
MLIIFRKFYIFPLITATGIMYKNRSNIITEHDIQIYILKGLQKIFNLLVSNTPVLQYKNKPRRRSTAM